MATREAPPPSAATENPRLFLVDVTCKTRTRHAVLATSPEEAADHAPFAEIVAATEVVDILDRTVVEESTPMSSST